MRHLLRVLVAVTIVLTVSSSTFIGGPAPAFAAAHDPVTDLQTIERLLYSTSMSDFVAIASLGDAWLDMSTDFCSAPLVGTTGRSFDFHGPCRRHDFGYRNLKLLDRRWSCASRPPDGVCSPAGSFGTYWTAASRKRVDEQFLADMRSHCRSRPWYDEPTCYAWAQTFYAAVRVGGGI